MTYALTEPQILLLREIAAASDAVTLPPSAIHTAWALEKRGDCVFTLVREETAKPPLVPMIDVPDVLDRPHRLVRATRTVLGRSKTVVDTRMTPGVIPMHVSRAYADRVLRIMHAFLTEAERRGHQVETHTGRRRGRAIPEMVVIIRGHALPLAIRERTTKVPHEPTAEETNRQQRFSRAQVPKDDHGFDGHLERSAPAGSGYQTWYACGGSTRWTLEARLGHLLHNLEGCAAAAERRQQEEELRKAEQAAPLTRRGPPGPQAASRAASSAGACRAGDSLAPSRRHPRLLPRGPRPSRRCQLARRTGVVALG